MISRLVFVILLLAVVSSPAQLMAQRRAAVVKAKSQVIEGGGVTSSNLVSTSPVALTARDDFNGGLGFSFTPTVDLTVTEIGRWVVSGNAQTHSVGVSVFSTGAIVASNVLNTSGLPVGYNTVSVTPAVLSAGVKYVAWSIESSGGDQWYETQPYSTTSDATLNYSVYYSGAWTELGSGNAYVPPQIKVHR